MGSFRMLGESQPHLMCFEVYSRLKGYWAPSEDPEEMQDIAATMKTKSNQNVGNPTLHRQTSGRGDFTDPNRMHESAESLQAFTLKPRPHSLTNPVYAD